MIIRLEFSPDETSDGAVDEFRALAQFLGYQVDWIERHKSLSGEHYARELDRTWDGVGRDWLAQRVVAK